MHLVSEDDEVDTFNDEPEMPEDALQPFSQLPDQEEISNDFISPFQRAAQSTREMRDMFQWWTQKSTPISDDESSVDEEEFDNENEREAFSQCTSHAPRRGIFRDDNMVKRWRQKRVVPGLYGLVMYDNEIKEEGLAKSVEPPPTSSSSPETEQDTFLERVISTKGGGGFYEKRSVGTCATEAMTEASGNSNDLSEVEVGAACLAVSPPSPTYHSVEQSQSFSLTPESQLSSDVEQCTTTTSRVGAQNNRQLLSTRSSSFRPIDEELDEIAMQDMGSFRNKAEREPTKRRKAWTIKEKLFAFGLLCTIAGFVTVLILLLQPSDQDDDGANQNTVSNENVDIDGLSDFEKLKALLSEVALDGGVEFNDPTSYQSKALSWLSSDSQIEEYSKHQMIQRWVLACIYVSTNNMNDSSLEWFSSDNWLDTQVDECKWMGIVCNDQGERSVVSIHLRNNRLIGTFPAEVSLLAESLEVLDLSRNFLVNEGVEGHMFLEKLTNLRKLDFGSNYFAFTEGIPPQMKELTNLVGLDVSNTRYTGKLPGNVFAGLQSLQDLRLGRNVFNSSIPVEIGNLPSLKYLHIENAGITGDLGFMKPMETIFEVWLDQNPNLSATLPTFLGELTSLVSLSISECSLRGSIPTELGQLENLHLLWLNNNKLSGDVPSELGMLEELRRMDIKGNDLIGQMPPEICANTRLPNGFLAVLEADCRDQLECSCCSECF